MSCGAFGVAMSSTGASTIERSWSESNTNVTSVNVSEGITWIAPFAAPSRAAGFHSPCPR